MFDAIVVGGGLSGLRTADLLSEDGKLKVLVLEASEVNGNCSALLPPSFFPILFSFVTPYKLPFVHQTKRFGGRTMTVVNGRGGTADMGGQWAGPMHNRLLQLAASLDVETFPQYLTGKNIMIDAKGKASYYEGTIPSIPVVSLIEIQVKVLWAVDRLCKNIDVSVPWESNKITGYDNLTLAGWASQQLWSQVSLSLHIFGYASFILYMLRFPSRIVGV